MRTLQPRPLEKHPLARELVPHQQSQPEVRCCLPLAREQQIPHWQLQLEIEMRTLLPPLGLSSKAHPKYHLRKKNPQQRDVTSSVASISSSSPLAPGPHLVQSYAVTGQPFSPQNTETFIAAPTRNTKSAHRSATASTPSLLTIPKSWMMSFSLTPQKSLMAGAY
jgi:hypothetical protein